MSTIRDYNHLLCRVEYPEENGYRMEPKLLPHWIHITITEETGIKYATVHSRIHVNKEVRVGPSYDLSFSDKDIIRDISEKVTSRFLN